MSAYPLEKKFYYWPERNSSSHLSSILVIVSTPCYSMTY